MKKLIVVIGLPGSGKSYRLKELQDTGIAGWICEDFHANAYNDSERAVDSRYLKPLIEQLQKGIACAIADIAFCDPIRRDEFEDELRARVPDIDIQFQCFRNDKDQCIKNVERRARQTVANERKLIEKFSPIYEFPPGAQILGVYREEDDSL